MVHWSQSSNLPRGARGFLSLAARAAFSVLFVLSVAVLSFNLIVKDQGSVYVDVATHRERLPIRSAAASTLWPMQPPLIKGALQ